MSDLERADESFSQKIGLVQPDLIRAHKGIEVLEQLLHGKIPYPAMSQIIPFRVTSAARGQVTVESEPSKAFYNTAGIVHGGFALTLLDTCMGLAVYSTLEAKLHYTTIETKVNFVRPITEATGLMRAIGNAIHTGTRTGTAEGRLVDHAGVIYAHGTTTCFLLNGA
ncbi:MAG: PaaI family thioesterase [Verrucomicrobia bacterium]|nr:PaaI family thioesterase [Verrucomicrobiota bacterium]